MTDTVLSLHLNRAQRSQFFAHILTYLLGHASNSLARLDKESLDRVHEVLYRLFQLCGDESEERIFLLSLEEGQVITNILLLLQPMYEQWANGATDTSALEHLATCRVLLQEAEQQRTWERGKDQNYL